MHKITEDRISSKVSNRRVHMANERTFLAWIRTSIGIMAFGFVLEKFSLFVKQFTYFLQTSGMPESRSLLRGAREVAPPSAGYSSVLGILLVALGALMAILALIRYKKVERQIDEGTYRPSVILDTLLAMSVVVVGIFLLVYLVHSL